MKEYTLIIDTDSYAGNFERETTAYATGRYGECTVGSFEAGYYEDQESYSFEHSIEERSDDSECWRPCQIEKDTSGKKYNSIGINFNEKPTEEEISIIKRRSKEFLKNQHVEVLGYRLKSVDKNPTFEEL